MICLLPFCLLSFVSSFMLSFESSFNDTWDSDHASNAEHHHGWLVTRTEYSEQNVPLYPRGPVPENLQENISEYPEEQMHLGASSRSSNDQPSKGQPSNGQPS
eukprot:CAMPEP_0119037228 /NCGR_PEP_ID=MMETSP1177-20130426/5458_1 /TAXON_ID=2985 /ORGANISM="Ochromonas sp, Strain CCMP1899" /LENGTH=102 /DNA_ID=CAMNT_0006998203 /DNA_START=129 /DNA_END=433 /DNA_ORIENTATION=+